MKSHGCFRKIENNIPLCLKHKYVFLELFIINFEGHFDIFEDISLSSLETLRFNCEHGLLTLYTECLALISTSTLLQSYAQ